MDHVDTFKLVAGGVIWLQAVVGGFAPLVLKDHVSPVVTSTLNMFAGGIFLAGSCLHLLPDAQENKALEAAGCMADGRCFKLANFFYGVGFLTVMMLEVFAHAMQGQYGGKPMATGERAPLLTKDRSTQEQPRLENGITDVKATSGANGKPADDHEHNGHHHNGKHVYESDRHSHGPGPGPGHTDLHFGLTNGRDSVNGLAADSEVCIGMEVTHAHISGIMDANPILAFVVFAALSFHSVMEGMGVGAANGAAWDILIAILAHKSLAAFALALELMHHKVPRERLIATIAIFSVMSPLGIFLGWLFVDATRETAASGICSAMAGGTFLFVAVMETIPQELRSHDALFAKCSALVLGFVSMGVLSIWA